MNGQHLVNAHVHVYVVGREKKLMCSRNNYIYLFTPSPQVSSLILIFMLCYRAPENAKIKQKMVYSASKDVLKSTLGTGISTFVQANDHGDITWDHVLEECRRLDRD